MLDMITILLFIIALAFLPAAVVIAWELIQWAFMALFCLLGLGLVVGALSVVYLFLSGNIVVH